MWPFNLGVVGPNTYVLGSHAKGNLLLCLVNRYILVILSFLFRCGIPPLLLLYFDHLLGRKETPPRGQLLYKLEPNLIQNLKQVSLEAEHLYYLLYLLLLIDVGFLISHVTPK